MECVSHVVSDGASAIQRKAVISHNCSSHVNLDNAIIKLIADQGVAVSEPDGPGRCRRGHAERISVRNILPDNNILVSTSTARELPASVNSVSPLGRRLANATAPNVPLAVNVWTICHF